MGIFFCRSKYPSVPTDLKPEATFSVVMPSLSYSRYMVSKIHSPKHQFFQIFQPIRYLEAYLSTVMCLLVRMKSLPSFNMLLWDFHTSIWQKKNWVIFKEWEVDFLRIQILVKARTTVPVVIPRGPKYAQEPWESSELPPAREIGQSF